MSEEEIRLDQTKKVFDMIADLISKNETCSYRYLIYDLLGFEHGDYGELMSGLVITNLLADYQKNKEVLDKIKEKCDLNKVEYIDMDGNEIASSMINKSDILELLEEIE